jgi:hypothetical protein
MFDRWLKGFDFIKLNAKLLISPFTLTPVKRNTFKLERFDEFLGEKE